LGPFPDHGHTELEARLIELFRLGLPLRRTTTAMLEELATSFGWPAAALWMPDPTHGTLISVGAWASEPQWARFVTMTTGATVPIRSSAVGRCWSSGVATWLDDLPNAAGLFRKHLLVGSGFRTLVFIPILGSGETLAVLEFLTGTAVDASDRDSSGAEQVLTDLAGLLRGHLAAEQAKVQQRRLELALASGHMGSWEWDARTGHVAWSPMMEELYGFPPGSFPGTLDAYRDRIHPDDREENVQQLARTIERREQHHVRHRIVLPSGEVRWVEGHGHPLYDDDGEFQGLTGVTHDVTDRVRITDELARQVELTAETLADRSRVADTLQRSLLPDRLPDVEGLDLASGFRPGTEIVGGDFFQVFCEGDDVYLALGDVCGKGPEAASLTAMARFATRGMVAARMRQPARILSRLNEVLLSETPDRRFLTMVLARLTPTPDGMIAVLCRAGHPLPVIRRAHGATTLVEQRPGMLLGAFDTVRLTEQTVVLRPGDALVLYTDGIIETRRDAESFGVPRLLATVADAPTSARELVDHLLGAVTAFDGGGAADDIAVLAAVIDAGGRGPTSN
jgi:PAS domain S-box-containing protein